MQTEQLTWNVATGWQSPAGPPIDARLILYFGARDASATSSVSDLHDQTVSITVIAESAA